MLRHIWPRDHPNLKMRVVIALGLLVSAKVIKVFVKYKLVQALYVIT